jgi:hypothetical protein
VAPKTFMMAPNIFFPGGSAVLGEHSRVPLGGSGTIFPQLVILFGRGVCSSQGLYLHRAAQHRKTGTEIHALSGVRIHVSTTRIPSTYVIDHVMADRPLEFSKCYM